MSIDLIDSWYYQKDLWICICQLSVFQEFDAISIIFKKIKILYLRNWIDNIYNITKGLKPTPPAPSNNKDDDDDWETDPDFVNDVSEQEQRWGSKTIEGSGRSGGSIE